MGLESFKQVVDKIRREDAFVGNIQLYQWGEPTLNRHLPDMIRYAREVGMLCTVSSNLNHPADFRALMASRPECLRISVSGTGERYAITHTGGTGTCSHRTSTRWLRCGGRCAPTCGSSSTTTDTGTARLPTRTSSPTCAAGTTSNSTRSRPT